MIFPMPPLEKDLTGRKKGPGNEPDFGKNATIHGQINEVTASADPPVVALQT